MARSGFASQAKETTGISAILVLVSAIGCSAARSCGCARTDDVRAVAAPVHKVKERPPAPKVIVFIWDGLRPDSVNPRITPNLAKMRDENGADFADNHAAYPTFTMMNAAAIATGAYPGTHGFYGNTEYQPGPSGSNATGSLVDFSQPVFTEDYGILRALDGYYRKLNGSGLFAVNTLFDVAHESGLTTAAVGKSGPVFLQDLHQDGKGGVVLDENVAVPRHFAEDLKHHGFSLPANTVHYPFVDGSMTLADGNGKPTATTNSAFVLLNDKATTDPRASSGSPYNAKNEYLMEVYLQYILPEINPDLSIIWLRNPDSTEHGFGPGTPNYLHAVRNQDMLLGKLSDRLDELGWTSKTDIIVVSDHGHSTVAGNTAVFPSRALTGAPDGSGAVGNLDVQGYSVSGDVRTADLLTRAGFAHVYDGGGCVYDPVLSGITADGSRTYPTRTDTDGSICGAAGKRYTTARFTVPSHLDHDAVVIAANGGSEYLYVPSHDRSLVGHLVIALQQRRVFGPIFVNSAYGELAGTLSLQDVNLQGSARGSPPTPDIVVSFDWDAAAVTAASGNLPGTEYESAQNNRGMHGSFSPIDVHSTLIASGPDFKRGYRDPYPSGNVDVPVTVAFLLGLNLPQANGRVLREALVDQNPSLSVVQRRVTATAQLSKTCNADDPGCVAPGGEAHYEMTLYKKILSLGSGKPSYSYFDKATVTRTAKSRALRPDPPQPRN